MKFLTKLAVICNICFAFSVGLRYQRFAHSAKLARDAAVVNPFESTLVILGYGAIIMNMLFFIVVLIHLFQKKSILLSRWMILVNLLFFILQCIYFFF